MNPLDAYTWEYRISGEDGVSLSEDDPELELYDEFVTDLRRYQVALSLW